MTTGTVLQTARDLIPLQPVKDILALSSDFSMSAYELGTDFVTDNMQSLSPTQAQAEASTIVGIVGGANSTAGGVCAFYIPVRTQDRTYGERNIGVSIAATSAGDAPTLDFYAVLPSIRSGTNGFCAFPVGRSAWVLTTTAPALGPNTHRWAGGSTGCTFTTWGFLESRYSVIATAYNQPATVLDPALYPSILHLPACGEIMGYVGIFSNTPTTPTTYRPWFARYH